MKIIDLHCDTLLKLVEENRPVEFLKRNNCWHIDLERLKASDYYLQFFAAFIETGIFPAERAMQDGYERALQMFGLFEDACVKFPDLLCKVTSVHDMEKARREEKVGGILTVEEAGILDNDLGRIDSLYEKGVRLMTLTWNIENCLGFPNSREEEIMNKGLKPFGIEAVRYMSEKKMIVDVSHLNDGGFWDAVRYSMTPVIASHSNCRALVDHPRNLTDDMLRAVGEKGGLVGLNFLPGFLGTGDKAGTLEMMIRHIRHMEEKAGVDAIALGTDFDGFHDPCEVRDAGSMRMLEEEMEKNGFSINKIEKILYRNAERFLKDSLPAQ